MIGLIDLPGLNQCYYASLGHGAFCNGKRFVIEDDLSDFENEIIVTGDVNQFKSAGALEIYFELLKQHRLVRTIPDCFGHALAMQGRVGAMIDVHLNPWDVAATKIITEEAGGKYVLLSKTETAEGRFKYDILFGKPRIRTRHGFNCFCRGRFRLTKPLYSLCRTRQELCMVKTTLSTRYQRMA